MDYRRMPIEIESPEQLGYEKIECNLAESSVNDMVFGKINLPLQDLLLCYGDHRGKAELRELIARDAGLNKDEVLITAGAAAALFIINTSLLDKGKHALILKPNYSTNIETPRLLGSDAELLELFFDKGFRLDRLMLEKALKPSTRLISLTSPHNPTGIIISHAEIKKILDMTNGSGTIILVDETYRGLSFRETEPYAAMLDPRVISISSLSKAYGLPGIRIGWILSRNKEIMEKFLAAKEQMYICNSVLDEEAAFHFLNKKGDYLPAIQKRIDENFKIVKNWMESNKYLEWIRPEGGVVCFPRIKSEIKVNIEEFYSILNRDYKTWVGPGHWFEMEKRYMRIGYAWPDREELKTGLNNINRAIEDTLIK